MTGFVAFARREMLEQWRSFRLLILAFAFLFVGLASPLLAKLTPELLGLLGTQDLGGMEIVLLKAPGVTDAPFQYQKNFAMLPLLVVLLTFGTVVGEKRRGTAEMSLVKPVTRVAWLLAKGVVPSVILALGTLVSTAGCALYTTVLFGQIDMSGFVLVNGLLLLNLLFFLSLAILGSVVAPSGAAAAGIGAGGWILSMVVGAVPVVGRYTPGGLAAAVQDLVMGRIVVGLPVALAVTAALTVGFFGLAAMLLQRQEL